MILSCHHNTLFSAMAFKGFVTEAVSGKFNHQWKRPVSNLDETYTFECEIENIRKQCTLIFAKNGFLWILEGPGLFFGQ